MDKKKLKKAINDKLVAQGIPQEFINDKITIVF